MKRYPVRLSEDVLQGIRSCCKAERISQDKVFNDALTSYLQGFELLILGPEIHVTTHRSHQEALHKMAGAGNWYASKDFENRSFEGNGIWARIVRVEVPR